MTMAAQITVRQEELEDTVLVMEDAGVGED